MPGKYSELRNTMQRYNDNDDAYSKKVDLRRADFSHLTKAEVAERFKLLKNRKAKLEEIESKINLDLKALDRILVSMMEGAEEESFKLTSGGSFFLSDKLRVSVVDKKANREWAMVNGYENDLMIHHKKLESICGELAIEGENVNIPGVECTIETVIGARNILKKNQ